MEVLVSLLCAVLILFFFRADQNFALDDSFLIEAACLSFVVLDTNRYEDRILVGYIISE